MCGQIKICELAPLSFPICEQGNVRFRGVRHSINIQGNKVVVEKRDDGELSIYFINESGNHDYDVLVSGGEKGIMGYAHSTLKAVLLENSNMGEVLPELELMLLHH